MSHEDGLLMSAARRQESRRCSGASMPVWGLPHTDGRDYRVGNLCARILLLAGDQASIAHDEGFDRVVDTCRW